MISLKEAGHRCRQQTSVARQNPLTNELDKGQTETDQQNEKSGVELIQFDGEITADDSHTFAVVFQDALTWVQQRSFPLVVQTQRFGPQNPAIFVKINFAVELEVPLHFTS